MLTETLTLGEYLGNIHSRAQTTTKIEPEITLPNLNMFRREITRAETATVDTVKGQLPDEVTEQCLDITVSDHSETDYDYWVELQESGFKLQMFPARELQYNNYPSVIRTNRWDKNFGNLITCKRCRKKLGDSAPKDKKYAAAYKSIRDANLLPLPNTSTGIGFTFRCTSGYDDENGKYEAESTRYVWGFSTYDIEKALLEKDQSAFVAPAYRIGYAYTGSRPPTSEELEDLARPHLFEHIFGIKPPTDEEIKQALLDIHIKEKKRREDINPDDWFIDWCSQEELEYPIPKGAFYTYLDAQESGLFDELSFGELKQRPVQKPKKEPITIWNPVLVGTYKGFNAPLCYWS